MNISQYLDPTQKIKYIIRLHVQQCINMQQHRTYSFRINFLAREYRTCAFRINFGFYVKVTPCLFFKNQLWIFSVTLYRVCACRIDCGLYIRWLRACVFKIKCGSRSHKKAPCLCHYSIYVLLYTQSLVSNCPSENFYRFVVSSRPPLTNNRQQAVSARKCPLKINLSIP